MNNTELIYQKLEEVYGSHLEAAILLVVAKVLEPRGYVFVSDTERMDIWYTKYKAFLVTSYLLDPKEKESRKKLYYSHRYYVDTKAILTVDALMEDIIRFILIYTGNNNIKSAELLLKDFLESEIYLILDYWRIRGNIIALLVWRLVELLFWYQWFFITYPVMYKFSSINNILELLSLGTLGNWELLVIIFWNILAIVIYYIKWWSQW